MATETPDVDDNPDVRAAYKKASDQDTVGMRALAGLFLLEHEFRRVPRHDHLARLVVNRLNRFAPYDCAVFWTYSRGGKLYDVTISGVVKSKETKPVLNWGAAVARWLNKTKWANTQITPGLIDNEKKLAGWPDNMPKSGLYVPLRGRDGKLRGGILLLRHNGWSQPVRVMLDQLAEAAAYTVDALDAGVHGGRAARGRGMRYLVGLALVGLLGLSFLVPVPVSVTVPAQLAISNSARAMPRGPAQIDLSIPPRGAMALQAGSRLKTQHGGQQYELEVEYISPWLAGLFANRQVRARVVAAPDGLAPPALDQIEIQNASMPLPLYLLRGPISALNRAYHR